VFDLDLTLGDLSPVMEMLIFFFPELYTEDGKVTFPASMKEGLGEAEAQAKLEETWGRFVKYKARAYTLFARNVLLREIKLHATEEEPVRRGCLMRPIVYRILYTLKNTPGCQGLMILSNNTLRPCVEIANYLLFGLGRYFKQPGANSLAPFDPRLLLHHGHRYRETERSQQKIRTGQTINNTLKSLWTVQDAFRKIGNEAFAAELGTPALPYASMEELVTTRRIFFADDLGDEHQLQFELENQDAQFMNCAPYKTQTRPRDLLAPFWSAFIEASAEHAGAGQSPLALFVEYFDWLLDREFWTFGPLLKAGRDTIPSTIDEKADLFQRRCSQYTFRVPEGELQSDPTKYPLTRAYAVWEENPLEWLDKLSAFHENLEDTVKGGRRKSMGSRKYRKTQRKIRIRRKVRHSRLMTKKMKGAAWRRRTGLTISRHAL
jgi:hypothetical protein